MHARKCVETEGKKERRQGCQRLGRIGHRGKKTPTPANEVGDDLGAGRSTEVETVFDEIRRSGSDVVKRSFPRSCCAETKDSAEYPRDANREREPGMREVRVQ
jgi:hypothetical protein